MMLCPAICWAQDSLVTYQEADYEFQAPADWQRDTRGVDPLFYLPGANNQPDHSIYFSILREHLGEGEELTSFVQDHYELSVSLWRRQGSEITVTQDTTFHMADMPVKRLTLYLSEFDQQKMQWFVKVDSVVYIFELTTGTGGLNGYKELATAVVNSFRVKRR
jgi:hypothetical protein